MDEHPALKSPEMIFLDECIAVIQAMNARTAALIAEYDRLTKRVEAENEDCAAPQVNGQ